MTEQAPERIWVQPWPNGAVGDCWHNATTETERPWEFTEYTRTDISLAHVAVMLEKAAGICDEERHNTNILTSNPPQSAAAVGVRNLILALIDTDHQAALDAVRAAERERCAKIADDVTRSVVNPDSLFGRRRKHTAEKIAAAIREKGDE